MTKTFSSYLPLGRSCKVKFCFCIQWIQFLCKRNIDRLGIFCPVSGGDSNVKLSFCIFYWSWFYLDIFGSWSTLISWTATTFLNLNLSEHPTSRLLDSMKNEQWKCKFDIIYSTNLTFGFRLRPLWFWWLRKAENATDGLRGLS